MREKRALIWIILVVAVAGGCATLSKKPPKKIAKVTEKKLFHAYLQKGREYEAKGDLVEALKQYKLAVTVNPSDRMAIENHNRLEKTIRQSAKTHYKVGLKFHKAGQHDRARRHFLIALRLRPDYPEALKMLTPTPTPQKPVPAKRYIVHTIKPGESLSKVAMIYYGDYHKFPIIAEYNNIADATLVAVGQKIKVPEIEGVSFLAKREDVKTEKLKVPEPAQPDQKKKKEEKADEEPADEEPVDTVAIYRDHGIDLFNKKQYEEAVVEFNKVLNVEPDDAIAREYCYKSHFQQAMALFEKEDYLSAKKEFEASLRYKSDCQKCHEYAKRSEEIYKDIHYKRGISYFGKEQLAEAIKEWELIHDIDPGYKEVEKNINKAKTLLKRLEEIRKAQEQQ